jgi:2-polyprenyl-3-methyl-5-hydroxy-6-metoxy-1,4-benzoquinol methylase
VTENHQHQHEPERFTQEFWDARYRTKESLWSGKPNAHLVAQAGDLAYGTALDAGAGEGADAIWLAGRGWRVTAVDISAVALERAAGHAAQAGDEVAGRITWRRENLLEWQPAERGYDLVAAHYLHLPSAGRQSLFRRLAAAVADGGTLLIVAHHPSDLRTTVPRPQEPDLFFTGDDIATQLDGQGWEIVTNVAAPRQVTDPDGRQVTIHDTVFRARRT